MYPKKTVIQKDTCTPMFNAAVLTMSRTGKQSRCPSPGKWIKKCGTYIQWCVGGGGLVTKLRPPLVTPWATAHQAPLSMGFSRQEHWSGLPFPSGDLLDQGIEPGPSALQAVSLPTEPPGKPTQWCVTQPQNGTKPACAVM